MGPPGGGRLTPSTLVTDRRIAEVDDLPDGRRLVVFADGTCVVVGTARWHAHPVAGWDWLGAHRRGAPPAHRRGAPPAQRRPARRAGPGSPAYRRADDLLRSLLDPVQTHDYATSQGFWVPTPHGPVRLGRLYHLVHRPVDEPHLERILCVVPRHYGDLPLPDIWVNLLLTLAVEPEAFFAVANLVHTRSR